MKLSISLLPQPQNNLTVIHRPLHQPHCGEQKQMPLNPQLSMAIQMQSKSCYLPHRSQQMLQHQPHCYHRLNICYAPLHLKTSLLVQTCSSQDRQHLAIIFSIFLKIVYLSTLPSITIAKILRSTSKLHAMNLYEILM